MKDIPIEIKCVLRQIKRQVNITSERQLGWSDQENNKLIDPPAVITSEPYRKLGIKLIVLNTLTSCDINYHELENILDKLKEMKFIKSYFLENDEMGDRDNYFKIVPTKEFNKLYNEAAIDTVKIDKAATVSDLQIKSNEELLAIIRQGENAHISGSLYNRAQIESTIRHKKKLEDLAEKKQQESSKTIIGKIEIVKGDKIEQYGKENGAQIKKNDDKKTKEKWYQNPSIVVPAVATILGAIISSSWWLPLFQHSTIQENKKPVSTPAQTLKDSSNQNINAVRALMPLETGKKIGELPSGIYFFSSSSNAIVYEIKEPKYDFLEATNEIIDNYSFEIQKINNRYYIVGFIADEAYSNIGSVNSEKPLYTILFPNQWGGATNPIAIPFDDIYSIKDRTIDIDERTRIGVLDVGFNSVKDNPETHTRKK